MTISNINVEESIQSVLEEVEKDKSLSPALVKSIKVLVLIINLLVARIGLNSKNSSLPPSKDGKRKRRRKKRKKSTRKPGGQDGHEGTTLEQFAPEDVDEIIPLEIDRGTLPENENFVKSEDEVRQVVDVNLEFKVREYRAEVLVDSRGNRHVADFPPHIKKAIQYGPTVKSLAVYLSQYQLLPYRRVRETFRDQFGLDISEDSLCNFNKEAYDMLSDFEKKIRDSLGRAKVLHVDETGIKVNGEFKWLHVVGNDRMTLYFPHEKRGKDAMEEMGVIPDYGGVLCHDHWKPYMGYRCRHALCNAHHLRELEWVVEFKGHKWAGAMKRFLQKLNKRVDESGGKLCDEEQKKKSYGMVGFLL